VPGAKAEPVTSGTVAPRRAQQGGAALAALSAVVIPTLVALLLAGSVAWLAQRLAPVGPVAAQPLESAIVYGQLDRAATIPADTDVVVVGDSSGLINVDPAALGAGLDDASVEGLATVAFAGPSGQAMMLDRLRTAGADPQRVLLALRVLALPTGPNREAIRHMLDTPPAGPAATAPRRMRDRLQALVAPTLFQPLPSAWGDYYGGVAPLAALLRDRHGFLHDPGKTLPRNSFPIAPPYDRNAAFEAELPALAAAVAAIGPQRVRLLLMPELIAYQAGRLEAARADSLRLLHERLGLDPALQLDGLPDGMPGDRFASITHLNALGRAEFTAQLAAALRRDRDRNPW
jgi:hypothetical protein